ncbi:ATP-dependent Clp protease adapter ClpS [Pikeienuella piscinae]|uniref:ATP-dependent Clp protease adapter protein ClpS n=1 Tax=Pikeienuella piscinae TaxID=2748098 RepID=A0A7L5BVR0_9RHOB|nr:ATP-dependent Clp protease adapter ClpS [Pikeienuella piscinae]QIE55491.1 ATP-dependent Clp protease adapter ClpS [Pikeienuella piscinae]
MTEVRKIDRAVLVRAADDDERRKSGPDDDGGGDTRKGGADTAIIARPKSKTQRPSLYKVMLLNDDYTPMEFVVHVLERIFGLTNTQAVELMLTVHRRGLAVVGVFSFEVAETKVTQVMDYARRNEHPLQCTMEKE